jgi:hypothetical protein
MPVVVLDQHVLVQAFEGGDYQANLLTLLALGAMRQAVDEQQLEHLLAEEQGWELRGTPREQIHQPMVDAWEALRLRVPGLSDEWQLATSTPILDEMRSKIADGRRSTHLSDYSAWLCTKEYASRFVSQAELDAVGLADVPDVVARTAIAAHAEWILTAANPPARSGRSWWDKVRRRSVLGPAPPQSGTIDWPDGAGATRVATCQAFLSLEEAPAIESAGGSLTLLHAVLPPPHPLRG